MTRVLMLKHKGTDLVPLSVGDLELSIVRGVETHLSKSNIEISEHHMGILAQ